MLCISLGLVPGSSVFRNAEYALYAWDDPSGRGGKETTLLFDGCCERADEGSDESPLGVAEARALSTRIALSAGEVRFFCSSVALSLACSSNGP